MAKKPNPLTVETLKHDDATRKNIPTAEYQSVMQKEEQSPVRIAYERRNRDLDPQLVWRGKDEQDWSDLVVHAPPLYIQEKVHPKVLIDDLKRQTEQAEADKAVNQSGFTTDLFADFNGLPDDNAKTEFYQHDAHWANRMILGDSLQVMASLAEREGMRGKVQCIYFDPPYGIKFNSNFQWSTTSRDVKDGNTDHITREPEQVKAFRDTWRDGIHSYLTYLRDRLTVARDLLTDSGSIFVQIGDENVHRVRAVMDEVFGEENGCSLISFVKTSGFSSTTLPNVTDYILWYAKKKVAIKYRQPLYPKTMGGDGAKEYTMAEFDDYTRRTLTKEEKKDSAKSVGVRFFRLDNLRSQGASEEGSLPFDFEGVKYPCGSNMHWKTKRQGLFTLAKAQRISGRGEGRTLCYVRFIDDFAAYPVSNVWTDAASGDNQVLQKLYVVQTLPKVIERCLLMVTDPGDLVLDPTCGSGTTAYVAEQLGRRWITLDTSRVALALARARIMGARYPYYLLADSRDGQIKEAEVTRTVPSSQPTRGNIRHGFVYERVPHITLKSIANNAEIDVIWDKFQQTLEPLREQLNKELGKQWQEWEIPRDAETKWPDAAKKLHVDWWNARIARQKEIDASIAAKAEFEYLYDKPYEDRKKVRVAGPFTVESLSPHRVLAVDENDELIDGVAQPEAGYGEERDFVQMILENLKTAGVQQAHKEDKITFTALTPWPGDLVCAEGRYEESGSEKRAAIFIGPEFGTVSRPDLVAAAREAGDADFDVLIACAFNYDAHSSEFDKLGRIPVLKARMNADLHMAADLKNTGKGNLFVIFGEPDIDILEAEGGQVRVKVNGVDVFHPNTGEVRSDGAEGIACWFIDTDYNEESFFVRHAYFLGANDPYKALKTTLKAEINEEAWASLNSDTSRAFDKPKSGRIAVKVINHLGDEVMKVFRVS
ncbi:MAG: site-specific DNA-methyltransferase [Sulfuricella sp.]